MSRNDGTSNLGFIAKITLILIAFYFLVFPFINSAISHNYYLKVNTDGSPSQTWIADLVGSGALTVEVYGRGNVATQQGKDDEHETFSGNLSDSDFEQIAEVLNTIRGFHILVRLSPGYTFNYSGQGFQATFYSTEEKHNLLKVGQILEYYARGDEKLGDNSGYQTYIEAGRARLKTLRTDLGLQD